MASAPSRILFDPQDYELRSTVNEVLDRNKPRKSLKKLLDPYLHPHGIKEMAAPTELRTAYAVIHLLGSLEVGKAQDRLEALRALYEEVLHSATSSLRKNTARVLLQIMKNLVRAQGDPERQLELAHDFRQVATGKPRYVREQLRRYDLLEMPEAWNHIAFDDHVHDASTKGRKTPTHLVMDAWIKGQRSLTVIYYNFVRAEVAAELLEAAKIVGLRVTIGVEFSARFRDRYAKLIWAPTSLADAQDFLAFLRQPQVEAFMALGREVSDYQQQTVLRTLRHFNEKHLPEVCHRYGIHLEPLSESDFMRFVGIGQASTYHLAKFVFSRLMESMEVRVRELAKEYREADPERKQAIRNLVDEMNRITSKSITERYLHPSPEDRARDPEIPSDSEDLPELLRLSPRQLIDRLNSLPTGCYIGLNPSNLAPVDVMELLYDCQGWITHVEIFNLKDYAAGKHLYTADLLEMQKAINTGNVVKMKRILRGMIEELEGSDLPDRDDRIAKLTQMLRSLPTLKAYYKGTRLMVSMGSDSTGRSRHLPGMGLAVIDTLPPTAQREIEKRSCPSRQVLPIHITTSYQVTFRRDEVSGRTISKLARRFGKYPGLHWIGHERRDRWLIESHRSCPEEEGNVVTLAEGQEKIHNGLYLEPPPSEAHVSGLSWRYLNSSLKNFLKVFIGFIPAFLTFSLTKEWWFLAYFGAVIWFAITGLRNILQSVFGGGGILRSPMLKWNDYVSWDRLTDSLLFTGFSVPLLDFLVKRVILDQYMGITTTTNPDALYTIMALANGLYLSSHNALRGLPKGAVYGNFFRSILSIPLAIGFNAVIGALLGAAGVVAVNEVLQKWAAVISKAASDCVAGVIEGTADRFQNIRMRQADIKAKLDQLFDAYSRLEVLFPETDILELISSPKKLIRTISSEARDLEKTIITNALDMMYFWMFQPHARTVLRRIVRTMTPEERQLLLGSQMILKRQKEISQMFIDGLVGKRFSKPLALYLDRSEAYLEGLSRMVREADQSREFATSS